MVTGQAGRFAGKVAVVTGALGAIGSATARRLASEGARLVLCDQRARDALGTDLCAALRSAGAPDATAIAGDVSREAHAETACQAAIERWGCLDAVVNVAGMMTFASIEEHTEADWLRVLGVNLLGAAFFTKHAFRRMAPGGAVVNVASVHARRTSPLVASYAASKAGLMSLTRSAAIEGRAKGLRANAVLPGAVEGPMLRSNPNLRSGTEALEPGDVGTPDQIAAAIAFLASEEAAFVNGAGLILDGGRLAQL